MIELVILFNWIRCNRACDFLYMEHDMIEHEFLIPNNYHILTGYSLVFYGLHRQQKFKIAFKHVTIIMNFELFGKQLLM